MPLFHYKLMSLIMYFSTYFFFHSIHYALIYFIIYLYAYPFYFYLFLLFSYYLFNDVYSKSDYIPSNYNAINDDIVTWRLKAAIWPSASRGCAEHFPVATLNRPLLDNEIIKTHLAATKTGIKALPQIHGTQRNGDKNTVLELLKAVITIRFA
jgi:Ca2+/Na+ antiporter